jgi:hypothetical protein
MAQDFLFKNASNMLSPSIGTVFMTVILMPS